MKENIVNRWITNFKNGKCNNEVLFINAPRGYAQNIINNFPSRKVLIFKIEDLNYLKMLKRWNCVIVSECNYQTNEQMRDFVNKEIIYIDDLDSINKLILLLKDKSIDTNNEIKYELLLKIDIDNLLKEDEITIGDFVLKRLFLLGKINSKFEDINYDFLKICIKNYCQQKLLIASFAQLLYKLANLDFKSTAKNIGGNIREILGVKSTTINRNKLINLRTNQLNQGVRVYNLKENTFVTETKIKIAQELMKLESKELDITKISKITELPLKKVEKMYREAFLV